MAHKHWKLVEETEPEHGSCPHCGYCKCCGRGGSVSPYPYFPYYPTYPYIFGVGTSTVNIPANGTFGFGTTTQLPPTID